MLMKWIVFHQCMCSAFVSHSNVVYIRLTSPVRLPVVPRSSWVSMVPDRHNCLSAILPTHAVTDVIIPMVRVRGDVNATPYG